MLVAHHSKLSELSLRIEQPRCVAGNVGGNGGTFPFKVPPAVSTTEEALQSKRISPIVELNPFLPVKIAEPVSFSKPAAFDTFNDKDPGVELLIFVVNSG